MSDNLHERASESAGLSESVVLEALLVEDDDCDALILTAFAEMNGEGRVRFTRARTLAEANRLAGDGRFDMYFVDLYVGGGTALALLASLEDSGARPIVVSNVSAREVEQYRLNRGGLRFLSKGECSPARLGALVREAVGERALRPAA